jgi:predicted phosphatase
MDVIKSEILLPFDIDQTLVMYDTKCEASTDLIELVYGEQQLLLRPSQKHIDLLKHHRERGYFIIAWSANGHSWTERVIKALELESYVDLVMTKPKEYVDDKYVDQWMTNRIYLEED